MHGETVKLMGLNGFYELYPSITQTIHLRLPYARQEGTSGSGGMATLILKLLIKWG